ncbi:hypothetical protein CVT26_012569 [Gymnopilus dilepis]|uniref:Uncharacterized protein n=1 Tax=Gymnopilus dilepis TaxID=231916 RepID=A0A409WMW5_9AGAR|nr:hypothetical protein CVT26_012569 [Gymnopilus dilepis]
MPPCRRDRRPIILAVLAYINKAALKHLRACYGMHAADTWDERGKRCNMNIARNFMQRNIRDLIYIYGGADGSLFDILHPSVLSAYIAFLGAPAISEGVLPELADALWRPALWAASNEEEPDPFEPEFYSCRMPLQVRTWQEVTWSYDLIIRGDI